MSTKKHYSKEFKLQAVKLIIEEGLTVKEVANTIEVHPNSIYLWVSQYEQHGDKSFPGKGSRDFIYQNKIKMLEIENKNLKDELEVLKKFKAFLKKNQ